MAQFAGVICDACGKRNEHVMPGGSGDAGPTPLQGATGWFDVGTSRTPYDNEESDYITEGFFACSPTCAVKAFEAVVERLVARHEPAPYDARD